MPQFFISYRRDDSAGHAGRLHDRLIERFGLENIFMDVDAIGLGADFLAAVREAIVASDGLIAVIGREWLAATNAEGERRLDDPDDVVRLEIALAFELGVRVIPVLVQGAPPLRSADLPDDLKQLANLNALEVGDARFHSDVGHLIDVLGHISLDQASLIAMSTALEAPGEYGRGLIGVSMSFEVAEADDIDDFYLITLSFQPEDRARYTSGREQFFIEKGGQIARRQVLSFPTSAGGPRKPWVIAAISLIVIAGAAVGGTLALTGGGDDGPSPGAAISPASTLVESPGIAVAATDTLKTDLSTPPSPAFTKAAEPAGITDPQAPMQRLNVGFQSSEVTLEAGSTQAINFFAVDQSGERINDPGTTWQVISEAGTISPEGILTAGTKAGVFPDAIKLIVDQGALIGSATVDLTIEPGPLERLEVLPSTVVLGRGDEVQLTVTGFDKYGNVITGLESSWESSDGLSVDGNGRVIVNQDIPRSLLPGLVAWWPGNGNSIELIEGHNGIANGDLSYLPGVHGQAFRFDGDDQYITVQDAQDLDINGDVTLNFWAKRSVLGGPAVMVVKGAGIVGDVDVPTSYVLKFGSAISPGGNGDYLWGGFERPDGSDVFLSGPVVNDTLFHHYAYVRGSNYHRLHLDGVEVSYATFTGSPGSTFGLDLVIGSGPTRGVQSEVFSGLIDDVQIFDRALTNKEVEQIFTRGVSGSAYSVTVRAKYKDSEQTIVVGMVIEE